MNITALVGRITKDLELKYTPNGKANVRFTLAVNRDFKSEGQPEADFINCVAWNKTAENLANFKKKGDMIGVEGRIQTGSYEGQDGKRVYTTDVIANSIKFYSNGQNNQGQQTNHAQPQQQQQQAPQYTQQQPQQQYGQQPQQYNAPQQQQNNNPFQVQESDLPF